MVFWKKPFESDIDEISGITYNILSALKYFGRGLEPKFLTSNKKSNAKEFSLSLENTRELLERSINREGARAFPELGRTISFFSSLDDNKSCSIRILIGAIAKHVTNSVVVKLPICFFDEIGYNLSDFYSLFKNIVLEFLPYWGCVCSNKTIKQLDFQSWQRNKPTSIHWMNYFDETIVNQIGKSRFRNLLGLEEFSKGFFYKIQDERFDAENTEHVLLQQRINNILGLHPFDSIKKMEHLHL